LYTEKLASIVTQTDLSQCYLPHATDNDSRTNDIYVLTYSPQ